MTTDATAEFKKISALVDGGALKDPNGPVKMAVFKITKRLTEESFYAEFVQVGGTELLLKIILGGKGNTASYAMQGLLKLMCNLQALEYVSTNANSFHRLYELIYSDQGTVSRHALSLLAILTEFAPEGYSLIQQAAKKAGEDRQLHPHNRVITLLKDKDVGTQLSAFLLLNTILRKSVSVGAAEEINGQLSELELLSTLREMEKSTLDTRVREQLQILTLVLSNYETSFDPTDLSRAEAHLQHQEWKIDAFSNHFDRCLSGNGLTGRVIALHGTSATAGEKQTDSDVVTILKAHLQRLEQNLEEMKKEKDEAKLQREKEAKEQIEKQKSMEREMATHQEKLNETIDRLITVMQSKEKTRDAEKRQDSVAVAAIEKQIKEMKANQELLMKEYEEIQLISNQQQYLQQHKALWLFYQTVQCKLNEIFFSL